MQQPFNVRIMPEALFICDLHAHMARTEIIGFLGGTWNADTRELVVRAAFPCRALPIDSDAKVNVELDPASDIEAREQIEKCNLRVVGWYHSHPSFQPDPSVRDIQNQTSYQTLFRDTNTAIEPFLGIIVSPYDPRYDLCCAGFVLAVLCLLLCGDGGPLRLAGTRATCPRSRTSTSRLPVP